ncbi:hypothetical protein C8Q76DRAFT_688097 [Earliella scabrosa]|nr:hypothetical protein C8Q76DRAFT_688097 [Earliella scabrosa]
MAATSSTNALRTPGPNDPLLPANAGTSRSDSAPTPSALGHGKERSHRVSISPIYQARLDALDAQARENDDVAERERQLELDNANNITVFWWHTNDEAPEVYTLKAPNFPSFHPRDSVELVQSYNVDTRPHKYFDWSLHLWVTGLPTSPSRNVKTARKLCYRSDGVTSGVDMPMPPVGVKRAADSSPGCGERDTAHDGTIPVSHAVDDDDELSALWIHALNSVALAFAGSTPFIRWHSSPPAAGAASPAIVASADGDGGVPFVRWLAPGQGRQWMHALESPARSAVGEQDDHAGYSPSERRSASPAFSPPSPTVTLRSTPSESRAGSIPLEFDDEFSKPIAALFPLGGASPYTPMSSGPSSSTGEPDLSPAPAGKKGWPLKYVVDMAHGFAVMRQLEDDGLSRVRAFETAFPSHSDQMRAWTAAGLREGEQNFWIAQGRSARGEWSAFMAEWRQTHHVA